VPQPPPISFVQSSLWPPWLIQSRHGLLTCPKSPHLTSITKACSNPPTSRDFQNVFDCLAI
jgi:hypothetical protein